MRRYDSNVCCMVCAALALGCVATSTAPPKRAAAAGAAGELTFTEIDVPSAIGAMAPGLARDAAGDVWCSWLEPLPAPTPPTDGAPADEARRITTWVLRAARLDGQRKWSPISTVAAGTEFFANWADMPGLLPTADGPVYAHFLERIDASSPYAYGVVLMRSDDRGATWLRLGRAHTDRSASEHGFVATAAAQKEQWMFWLDGRAMSPGGHGDEGGGDMALMVRSLSPGAEHQFTEATLDNRTCECCNTSAALTSLGPIVVYRDRGADERRDISIVRFVNGAWTEPREVARDGWILPGCPVNGPSADARESTVVVAWYTAAEGRATIKAAISTDSGATFGEPIIIADELAAPRSTPLGRVAVCIDRSRRHSRIAWLGEAIADEPTALPLAADDHGGPAQYDSAPSGALRLTTIDLSSATVLHTSTIALLDASRRGGFPRLARLGDDDLLIIWTDAGARRRLRAAIVAPAAPVAESP